MTAKIPFVYLSSPPYSGSTLFSFLANTHPKIATVGEMTGPVASQDPETYKCSCGRPIGECRFWQRVAKQMELLGYPLSPSNFDTRVSFRAGPRMERVLGGSLRNSALEDMRDSLLACWPRHRRRLQYLVARNMALAAAILQVTGRSVFFDASKNPMMIRHLARQPDIDLRVIHLIRDVRGASLSRRKNLGQMNWSRTIKTWLRTNRNIERQLGRLGSGTWMRIRYEDLCRAPEATMRDFYAFCGLEPNELPRDFHSVENHIVGNRMRLAGASAIRLDESWRRTLTPGEQDCASRLAGSMMERYGYPAMSFRDIIHEPAA